MFKTELHAHCAPISKCASASAEELVSRYLEAGYATVVLTNHMNLRTFEGLRPQAEWADKVRYFLSGYEAVKQAAGERLHVLLGAEVYSIPDHNEYLLYGLNEDALRKGGKWMELSLNELCQKAHELGLWIAQAHPFRWNMRVVRPDELDGLEVYNALKTQESHNFLAKLWAEHYRKQGISGSDFHHPDSVIAGGICTRDEIRNNSTLLNVLRNNNYRLLVGSGSE